MNTPAEKVNTILGRGSVIHGTVKIENSIRLDVHLIGELHSSGTVTLGAQGEIEGDVFAKSAVIGGKIKGRIDTSDQIVLEANSVVIGDLKTARLTIDEGAMFEGNCLMTPDAAKSQEPKAEGASAPS